VVAKGTRIIGPAKTEDGRAISRQTPVEIVRVVGNVYYVRVAAPVSPPPAAGRKS